MIKITTIQPHYKIGSDNVPTINYYIVSFEIKKKEDNGDFVSLNGAISVPSNDQGTLDIGSIKGRVFYAINNLV